MEYKLVIDPIVIGEDYILGGYGSIGGDILQADGQWLNFLPDIESQLNNNGFDAIACASFGTLNAIEVLHRRMYGVDKNWSDRFLARASETTHNGNSPHKVAETLRQIGVPTELEYPYSPEITTWEQFYANIPDGIYTLAEKFLNEFDFKHEYVVTQPSYIKQALQFSPMGVSVCAWFQDENGLFYKPAGMTDNHWVCIVGYKEGEYWLVFDSYNIAGQGNESFIKKVKWDTPFQIAKRFSLPTHDATQAQGNALWAWLVKMFNWIKGGQKEAMPEIPKEILPEPTTPVPPPFPPTPVSKYDWSTTSTVRHSIRLICDEEALNFEQKNTMCATIGAESGYKLSAVNRNYYTDAQGVKHLASTDWGLCQWNDHYHGDEITPDEAMHNPEKAVRLMCKYWKKGELYRNWWIAYKNGSYKSYL